MSTSDRWQEWIHGLRNGDAAAIDEFWRSYGADLVRLAERNLTQRLRRRLDPEDVVQSAFRTFLRRAERGQFELADDDRLWQLLCAITLNKARQQARRHLRQKRSLQTETYLDGEQQASKSTPASAEPTPDEAAILVDLVEELLAESRDTDEREIVTYRLQDFTNEEIAQKVNCSERTVRRIVQRLRTRLDRLLN